MDDEFRRRANAHFARLLVHWRSVEFWIKRAEQVSKKAVIPAINELRYASRQLFNAQRLFDKSPLSNREKSLIDKRLTVAEQYLLNAEHDICDSIIVYYDERVLELDENYGPTAITILFPEYPLLKHRIRACQELIADARGDYDKRQANYTVLRQDHFPHLLEASQRLVDAEVGAREQKAAEERQSTIARSKIRFLELVAIGSGIAHFVGIALAIFLWLWAKEDFCEHYRYIRFFEVTVCRFVKPIEPDAAGGVSAPEKRNPVEQR